MRFHLDPPLKVRLRYTGSAPTPVPIGEDRALIARTFAYLFGFGATLLVVTLVLPGAADRGESQLAAITALAYIFSAVMLVGYDRLPLWIFRLMPLVGNALIGLGLVFGGTAATSAYALFFFWVALSAFYFFDVAYAVVCTTVASICYAEALIMRPEISLGPLRWAMLTGALFVAGAIVGRLRSRAERLVEQLSDAARTDVLTGLANRREFEMRLGQEVARAGRGGGHLALIALDVDRFKSINDRNGHHAGDLVLSRVAEVLRARGRDGDTLARVGGDEFGVIVPDADQAEAYLLAERLREAIGEAFERDPHQVTLSAGVASFREHGATQDALTEAADQALYAAKRLGRDCSVIYSREVAAGLVELGLEAAGHQLPTSLEAVIALAEVVDVRQMGSVKHSQTVGRYAEAMGERLGMDSDAVQRLRLAGILHDIGKIGIPGAILSKTGPLSEEEAEEMRRHPEIGSRIARNASLDDIAEWIGSHHERPDGCGYPVGLRDVQIPLEAQILAVADTYEAMTNDRAYRSAIPPRQAIEELRGAAGSQFDVRVVDVFVSLLEDGALEALPAKAGV